MEYFIKHFQSIWGLSSVIARSQLGASAGEIEVNKHLPRCVTEGIFQKRAVELPVCLRLIPGQEDMVEVPRLVSFQTDGPV